MTRALFISATAALGFATTVSNANLNHNSAWSRSQHKQHASRAAVSLPNGWRPAGCVVDSASARAISKPGDLQYTANDNTGSHCVAACSANGYSYAGVEYGNECYCGHAITISGTSGTTAPTTDCNMKCAGDASQTCGAGNRLTLFTNVPDGSTTPTNPSSPSNAPVPAGWTTKGCYSDLSTSRALTGYQAPDDLSGNTAAKCAGICAGKGFPFAGVEYGKQCFCGNSIVASSDAGKSVSASDCNLPCTGDASQTCGAGKRLMIYNNPSITPSNPPTSSPAYPSGWSKKGCYSDSSSARALTGYQAPDDASKNTPQACMQTCTSKGYPFAGVEYGKQCFCGNSIVSSSNSGQSMSSSDCNVPCTGDASQMCGAGNRLSIFNNPSIPAKSTPPPSNQLTSNKASVGWTRTDSKGLANFKNRPTKPKVYNWSPWKTSGCDAAGFTFCPMLWSDKQLSDFKKLVVEGYSTCVLGQNEPDQAGQSNMSPETALASWNKNICPLKNKGYYLVSPATTSSPAGEDWTKKFLQISQGNCSPDAVATHWYGTNFDNFKTHVNKMCSYGKPVWVTEFACQNFGGGDGNAQCSSDQIKNFMVQAKQFLEGNPCVEEYMWFGAFTDMGNVNPKNTLVNGDGSLNALGHTYVHGTV